MDILLELKAATAPQHEAIEQLIPLMRDGGEAGYEAYLQAFWGFLEPLESELCHVPGLLDALPDFPLRRKAAWIHADLQALGEPEWKIESLPRCRVLPEVWPVPRALGCLYVLEGSTLGGHVLRTHLRAKMPPEFERASHFLTSYGPNLGSMWRTFGEHLRAAVLTEADRNLAVEGARQTFGTLYRWLEAASPAWSVAAA